MERKKNAKITIKEKENAKKIIIEKINAFLIVNQVSLNDTAKKRLNEYEIELDTKITNCGNFISIDTHSGFWYITLSLYKDGTSNFSIGNMPF